MKNIVVAFDENRVIGKDNDLPWVGALKDDMVRFRRLTRGGTVIMGRKTFDSLPERMRPLPERQNIVISLGLTACTGVQIARSLEEAYRLSYHDEINVIGGGQIYELALPTADRIYATEIETKTEGGDALFPEIDMNEWTEVEREQFSADDRNKFSFSFVTYLRNRPNNEAI
jgi:dihydrofolate reductase